MIIKPAYHQGAGFIIRKVQLLEPCKLRLRRPNGTTYLCGYGVGDVLEIYEPLVILLVMTYEKLKEIPCATPDGVHTIIEWWDQFGNNKMTDATEVYEEFNGTNISQ